ncbi:MAG: enoyl-CoA hydratase/isomerase family protein [Streptosporangiaceae bacterium]
MAHPQLLVENGPAGCRWLRLSRPERRNALDAGLTRAVRDALAADPAELVLLGSSDPQVFCAGADLTISDAERAAVSDLIYDCCQTIITRPGPVVAVLSGAAVGGGVAMDLVLTGRWVEAAEALARLQAERSANQSAWARVTGVGSWS